MLDSTGGVASKRGSDGEASRVKVVVGFGCVLGGVADPKSMVALPNMALMGVLPFLSVEVSSTRIVPVPYSAATLKVKTASGSSPVTRLSELRTMRMLPPPPVQSRRLLNDEPLYDTS